MSDHQGHFPDEDKEKEQAAMALYFIFDIRGEAASFHSMLTNGSVVLFLRMDFSALPSFARGRSRPKMLLNIIDLLENQVLFLLNPRAIIKNYGIVFYKRRCIYFKTCFWGGS